LRGKCYTPLPTELVPRGRGARASEWGEWEEREAVRREEMGFQTAGDLRA
jgi:hypothetical protein